MDPYPYQRPPMRPEATEPGPLYPDRCLDCFELLRETHGGARPLRCVDCVEADLARSGPIHSPAEWDAADRRQLPRRDVLWSGTVCDASGKSDCIVLNVSPGGAMVQMLEPVFSRSSFRLDIPGIGGFAGRVAWRRPQTMGVEFLEGAEHVARKFALSQPSRAA